MRLKIGDHLKIFVLFLILGFLIGTPFAVIDYKTFIASQIETTNFLSKPWYGVDVGWGWVYHLRISLYYGLGWSLLFSGICGLFLSIRKDLLKGLMLILFPISYFLLIGSASTAVVRFMVPIVPFLCIGGAVFVDEGGRYFAKSWKWLGENIITTVMAVMIIALSLVSVWQSDLLLSKTDNRIVARGWLYENLENDSSVFQYGTWLGNIQFYPSTKMMELESQIEKQTFNNKRFESYKADVREQRVKRLRSGAEKGFDLWEYDQEEKQFRMGLVAQAGLPDYIIVYQTPLRVDLETNKKVDEIDRLMALSYKNIKSFIAYDAVVSNQVYDHQDAFYLPYSGFEGVERPGPNIYIYEKVD